MMGPSLRLMLLNLCLKYINSQSQDLSPCPRLFVYEGKSNEPGTWYGIITLLNKSDLKGIWLRVILDKPAKQLGNWFGQVSTTDNKEYAIKNRNFDLKAYVPHTVRFFIKYDPAETPPRLVSFRQNAQTVCPEPTGTESSTVRIELQTSGSNAQQPTTPNPVPPPTQGGIAGAPNPDPSTDGEEEFFPGDFSNFFNRPSRPSRPASGDQFDLNAVCGTVAAQPTPLITFGQSTDEGEFPWHVAIYRTKGIDLAYICGASLVSKQHMISAAHCVTRRGSQVALNPDTLIAYLGKYYLKRFSSAGIQDRQIATITPHPNYNPQRYSNDIAIVKFTQPADITDYVRPVCLWQEEVELSAVVNKQGTVVGWGFDQTGKLTDQLHQAKMPVVSVDACISSYPDFYIRFTTTNTYCAGFRNGTSVCNGDSGGGMVFPISKSNSRIPVWQLRGVVSLSVALQHQFCDTSHYVIFTDVAKYLDWVKQVMLK